MNQRSHRFYVVTGGPGAGKTSLIEVLRTHRYPSSVEAGRGVIESQVAIDGPALPWRDPLLFSELMLSWEMRSYRDAEKCDGPAFFDRGIPDVMAYLRLMNMTVPEHVHRAATNFRYNPTVFITPPWQDIFRQDRERRQDYAGGVRTYEYLAAAYTSLDYRLVEIPRIPVKDRAVFILDQLGLKAAG